MAKLVKIQKHAIDNSESLAEKYRKSKELENDEFIKKSYAGLEEKYQHDLDWNKDLKVYYTKELNDIKEKLGEEVDNRPELDKRRPNMELKSELESKIINRIKGSSSSKKSMKMYMIKYNEYMAMIQSKFYQGDSADKWDDFKKQMEDEVRHYKKTLLYEKAILNLQKNIEVCKSGIENLKGLVKQYRDMADQENDTWIKDSYEKVKDMYETNLGSEQELLKYYEANKKKFEEKLKN